MSFFAYFYLQIKSKKRTRKVISDKLLKVFLLRKFYLRKSERSKQAFGDKFEYFALDEWIFGHDYAYENLIKHFKTKTLKKDLYYMRTAMCGGCQSSLSYDTQHNNKVQYITSASHALKKISMYGSIVLPCVISN